jgi:hypothetical protein
MNPYKSPVIPPDNPTSGDSGDTRRVTGHRVQLFISIIAWTICFLTPFWIAAAEQVGFKCKLTTLWWMLLGALIGCGLASAAAPLSRQHRLLWFIATIPLLLLELIIICCGLLRINGLPVD